VVAQMGRFTRFANVPVFHTLSVIKVYFYWKGIAKILLETIKKGGK